MSAKGAAAKDPLSPWCPHADVNETRSYLSRITIPWRLRSRILTSTLILTPPLAAQVTTTVPDSATCDTCIIHVSRLVTLGDTVGPGIVGEHGYVWQSPDGEYYVTSSGQPGRVLVFDESGRFQHRFGRRADGPGEFVWPQVFHVDGDSIWIFDRGRPRVTTLLPETVETRNLPFVPHDAVRLGNSVQVYSAAPRTPALIGIPLHVLDETTGQVTSSFGNPTERFNMGDFYTTVRSITASDSATFWASWVNQYRIEKWTASGVLLLSIKRVASWFEDRSGGPEIAQLVQPKPVLLGVREGRAGSLWAFLRVADEEWAPLPTRYALGGTHLAPATPLEKEELFDTVVELIDIESGRVIARKRLDQNIMGIAGPNLFFSYEEVGVGHPKYVVWEVTLQR